MSAFTRPGAAFDRSSPSNGEMPFSSERLPPRVMAARGRSNSVDSYRRRSVARHRRNYRLALAAAWAATVVIPAVVTICHQSFFTMLGHLLAPIVHH